MFRTTRRARKRARPNNSAAPVEEVGPARDQRRRRDATSPPPQRGLLQLAYETAVACIFSPGPTQPSPSPQALPTMPQFTREANSRAAFPFDVKMTAPLPN